ICEKDRAQALCNPEKLRTLPFAAAADFWLDTRKDNLRPRTYYGYKLHVKSINKFLGTIPLQKLHIGHILNYSRARTSNEGNMWDKAAGASIVNHEVVTIQQVMDLAGEWERIAGVYKALPLPRKKKPKVMSDEEEMRLWAVASSVPEWEIAYLVASIGVNTGAVGGELRHLQIEDVQLDARV